jgi:ABC-type multidrug transport system fused ATPase/permease subunit
VKYLPRVLRYLKPYWRLAAGSAALMVPTSVAILLMPWPLTILVDNVLGDQPLPGVIAPFLEFTAGDRSALAVFAVGAGLAVTLVSGGLNVLRHYVNTKLEQRVVLDFRSDLFRHAERLSIPYADQVSTGRLMYGINFEAAAAGGVIMTFEPLAQSALTIVGMVWISFHIDPMLALLSVAVVPLLYYCVGHYATHIQPKLLRVKGMEADALSIVHDAMGLLRVIVAFGREGHEVRRFRDQGQRAVEARIEVTVQQTLFTLAVSMITAVGTALVLAFGVHQALQGHLTAGQLLVVLSYVAAVYKPLEAISYTIGSLQDRLVGLQMAYHILDTEPVVRDQPGSVDVTVVHGRIRFESVSFGYPGRPDALRNITFEAGAGQAVAVVGPTGAGKTTLVSLIPRFYDPTEGRILLDGLEVRSIALASLRQHISFVPQEAILFSGSVADNIRYGRLAASDDEIVDAARAANAHEFISRLPSQYDTPVGERGVQLSGGERQRICIARAFLKAAPILVLDEPTSAVDSKTEGVILDALDRLMVGRTTFMIAHRLSTVRRADVILSLDRGELVEQGTRDELWERRGLYRELWDAQIADPPSDGQDGARSTRPAWPSPSAARTLYSVRWQDHDVPALMQPGAVHAIRVRLTNRGLLTWRAHEAGGDSPVRVAYHWIQMDGGECLMWEGLRTPLPHDAEPDDDIEVTRMHVEAPAAPGSYILQITLVHENVTWFEHAGAALLTVPVAIERHGGLPTSAASRLVAAHTESRHEVDEP